MAFHQNALNSFCSSGFASEVTASEENIATRDTKIRIEESLYFKSKDHKDRIDSTNSTMSYQVNNTGERPLHYNINK